VIQELQGLWTWRSLLVSVKGKVGATSADRAGVVIVQAFLSIYLPTWLVWFAIVGYTAYSLLKEGMAVWKSRTFRILGIALLTLLVDLWLAFAV
jgi:hypothetical protein